MGLQHCYAALEAVAAREMLEGTNVQQGKDILENSGLPIVSADDLGDAAKKIVAEVKKAA